MAKNLVFLILTVFVSLASYLSMAVAQTSIKSDHVTVSLIAINKTQIAIHYKLDPHWHVYWKNPGDSGAAPKFEITGAELKEILWPYPQRLPVADLTNYGYEHEVLIPLEIEPVAGAKEISIDLEWLVCKIECVPGFAEFKLDLEKINPSADQIALYEKFKSRVPQVSQLWSSEFIESTASGVTFKLTSSADTLKAAKNIFVYPENGERFKTQNPVIEPQENSYRITIPLSANAGLNKSQDKTDTFAIVIERNNSAESNVDSTLKANATESFIITVENKVSNSTLLYALFFAFLGGLILNLMPCVFPVLSLKAMSFLNEDEAKIRASSWAYTAGVLVTFLAVGALLIFLRLSGQSVGWGFQLQNPWLVYLLATLFYFMALNFWGFFEIGNSLANSANKLGSFKFFSGSFGTGVLAVIVASPCTAPFMGSAIGVTLLLPPLLSLLIFLSLGFGMAAPMLLISYFPQLIRKLPRSGAWMESVKKFMAFPMLLTTLWLLWVLDQQKGSDAVFVTLFGFILIALFLWFLELEKNRAIKFLYGALIVCTIGFSLRLILQSEKSAAATAGTSAWQPFDTTVIEQKRRTQQVFVDFTAHWCITCQVNKRNVLNTEDIQKLFKDNNVFLVQADWTSYDANITKALAEFGRNSVPLYVFYDKTDKSIVLPEILTKQMIINLFNKGE